METRRGAIEVQLRGVGKAYNLRFDFEISICEKRARVCRSSMVPGFLTVSSHTHSPHLALSLSLSFHALALFNARQIFTVYTPFVCVTA